MPSCRATIAAEVGLHARPAAEFVKAAQATGRPITIGRVGQAKVNAHSILAVMALGIKQGEEVEVAADGEDSQGDLEALAGLLASQLDEAG